MSYRVGLTGGIGSGKSTVAALFAALGVLVIDTDAISHQLTGSNGEAIPAIRSVFGNEYIDNTGALDRAKMRQLVFADKTAKVLLEKILHPLIFTESRAQAEISSAPYVIIVVPLLFETTSFKEWMNRTVTVDCSEEKQIERITRRNGMNDQTARSIMSQQLSRAQRLALTDDTIDNEGDLAVLDDQVATLNQRYLDLAKISN
jgi:dephospho-CoA kinase